MLYVIATASSKVRSFRTPATVSLLHGRTLALENKNTLGLVGSTHLLVRINRHRVCHFALAVLGGIKLDLVMGTRKVVDRGDGLEAMVVAAVLGDNLGGALFVVLGVDREDWHLGVCCQRGGLD